MPVTTESAQVYRGGGRRWFTMDAAINAEAKAMFRACLHKKARCDCYTSSDPFDGATTCKYHDHSDPVYGRYMRYAQHLIKKATP